MGQTFRGGVPYAVDVNRLKEAFPVPTLTEGRIILHPDLALIVNSKKGEQRYYAVINSWIAQMRNANGIFIVWEPSVGIKILDPAGLLDHAEVRTRQKIRQTGRAIKTFAWVNRNRLDTMGQKRLDHDTHYLTALRDSLHDTTKQLAVALAPIKSLPKPKLIKEA